MFAVIAQSNLLLLGAALLPVATSTITITCHDHSESFALWTAIAWPLAIVLVAFFVCASMVLITWLRRDAAGDEHDEGTA
jgi:hypothetical protein